jgi:D-alanyl-D-alanine carboxypeptidase
VSLRDLLYAAMMSSDNHAAYTLAWNVGGRLPNSAGLSPVDNFTAHMNALARKLGMRRTLFLNPHGLDGMTPPPHSTAADVARLTRYAYTHAGFNFYVSQPTREIAIEGADGTTREFLLRNTNELLGRKTSTA